MQILKRFLGCCHSQIHEPEHESNMSDEIKFTKGQKVRNQYGKTLTVLFQRGLQVFVKEECGSWYHPGKLWAVK